MDTKESIKSDVKGKTLLRFEQETGSINLLLKCQNILSAVSSKDIAALSWLPIRHLLNEES